METAAKDKGKTAAAYAGQWRGSAGSFLNAMLKYRCRILFTTRNRYENHISLEVSELNSDTLLELMGKFFPQAEKKQDDDYGNLIEELAGYLYQFLFAGVCGRAGDFGGAAGSSLCML